MLLLLVVILLVQRPHRNQPEKRCLMSCIDVPAMVTVTVLCAGAGLVVPLHPAVRSCVFQILLKCTYHSCAACSRGAGGEGAVCLAVEGGCDPTVLWLETLGQAVRGAGPWGAARWVLPSGLGTMQRWVPKGSILPCPNGVSVCVCV